MDAVGQEARQEVALRWIAHRARWYGFRFRVCEADIAQEGYLGYFVVEDGWQQRINRAYSRMKEFCLRERGLIRERQAGKRRRSWRKFVAFDPGKHAGSHSPTPEWDMRLDVQALLSRCTLREQQALRLRMAQLQHLEIGRLLGVGETAALAIQQRAIAHIRKSLARNPI